MYTPRSIENIKIIDTGWKKTSEDIAGPGQMPTKPQPIPNKPVPKIV